MKAIYCLFFALVLSFVAYAQDQFPVKIDYSKYENLRVYPHPINDEFSFNMDIQEFERFVLLDITGSVVDEHYIWEKSNKFSALELPSGIYFYQLIPKEGKLLTGKIVVDHSQAKMF